MFKKKVKDKFDICKATKKYCFSSEAKAIRSVNKYDDIKRAYICEFCEEWHTTSAEDKYDKIKPNNVLERIKKRYYELKNKLENEK